MERCEHCQELSNDLSKVYTSYFRDDLIAFVCPSCKIKQELKNGSVELTLWEDYADVCSREKEQTESIRNLDIDEARKLPDIDLSPQSLIDFNGSERSRELARILYVLEHNCSSREKVYQLFGQGVEKFSNWRRIYELQRQGKTEGI